MIIWCLAAGEARLSGRLAAGEADCFDPLARANDSRLSRGEHPARRRGAKSFADDLVEDRGVVPTRAVSHCDVLKVILQIYDLSAGTLLFFSPRNTSWTSFFFQSPTLASASVFFFKVRRSRPLFFFFKVRRWLRPLFFFFKVRRWLRPVFFFQSPTLASACFFFFFQSLQASGLSTYDSPRLTRSPLAGYVR